MKRLLIAMTVAVLAGPAVSDILPDELLGADIVMLGEIHDNPAHHVRQAAFVKQLQPAALVFEMLSREQQIKVTATNRLDPKTLSDALEWEKSGWPDFAMYYPIFEAAPEAVVVGAAVPRNQARAAMETGIADWFGVDAPAYGLTAALPEDQQEKRETLQQEAHCNALPETMLPVMVDLQRLRDAVIARAALQALDDHGAPVVVITGNGHARKDWGAPSYVTALRPDVRIAALGQTEGTAEPDPNFDIILSSPPVEREDPCNAFR